MKKISKETNIAFAIMYAMQIFAILYNRIDLWWTLFIMPIFYFVGVYFINKRIEKYKAKRKLKFMQYPLTHDECYDGKENINRCILDEAWTWDANPNKDKFISYLTGDDLRQKGLFEMFSIGNEIAQEHTFKVNKEEITVDDIRKWKQELQDAAIPNREYTIMKYCRHKNDLVAMSLPFKDGDCTICFEETFGKLLKDAATWYDPKAQELFSDFEKKKQEQFKKDCQSGKL